MPVTDLADYLGMPQQAPTDPLFYQNQRKVAIDREVGDFNQRAGARDQLYRLQRQAPVLQAQQAQLAYDEVAQQANDLRMKQEIEAQVERAANELAGGNLNPESDDFATKYRDLATRNPLAMSDPRFRQVAGLYEGQNQSYQQTRAAQAEKAAKNAAALEDQRIQAIESGVPREAAFRAKSPYDIAELRSQTGGKTQKDITGQMMEKDLGLLDSSIKDMIENGEDLIVDAGGVSMPNPAFQSLVEDRNGLRNELRTFYQGKYRPAATTPVAAPAPQPNQVVQPAPTPAPQIPLTPEGQIDIDKIPFGEIDKTLEKANEQAKAQEEVSKAWNDAQMDLEKKLEKLYPGNIGNTNYAKLARFAKAVLNGERIADAKASGAMDETGAPLTKSVAESALEELGLPFAGEAFVEPGKARKKLFGLVGDQRVPYNQLLEIWAKNYLQRAPSTVVPQVRAIPAEKVQKADEFLNSFQK